jgi:protein TonB
MKRAFISITFTALTIGATAQNTISIEKNDSATTISSHKIIASFPGGQKALTKFLDKNLQYPDAAGDYGVEGSVVMTFFVEKDGTLSEISANDCKIERFSTTKFSQETESKQKELKKQFALLFAKEGARVIRKMPKWIPAKVKGEAIPVKMELRLYFVDTSK